MLTSDRRLLIGIGGVEGVGDEGDLPGAMIMLDDLNHVEAAGDVVEVVFGEVGSSEGDPRTRRMPALAELRRVSRAYSRVAGVLST